MRYGDLLNIGFDHYDASFICVNRRAGGRAQEAGARRAVAVSPRPLSNTGRSPSFL